MGYFLTAMGYRPRPFRSGEDLLAEAESLPPGVVFLDVRMPGLDGLQVTRQLVDQWPCLPVVIMTGHGDIATAVASMKLGAADFIEKPFDEASVVEILDRIYARLDEHVRYSLESARSRKQVGALSPRELDVMRGLLEGLPNKIIAKRLDLSVRTVEMHRSKLMRRLKVRTTAEAIKIAILAGLPPHSDENEAGGSRGIRSTARQNDAVHWAQ